MAAYKTPSSESGSAAPLAAEELRRMHATSHRAGAARRSKVASESIRVHLVAWPFADYLYM